MYPKMLYHPAHGATVVVSADEEQALSAAWTDAPSTDTCSVSPVVVAFAHVQDAPELPTSDATDEPEPSAPKRKPGRPKGS